MSYYDRNKEKCRKNALERLHRLKETRNDDIKSYQALYFQLNKERIYEKIKKKPKVEKTGQSNGETFRGFKDKKPSKLRMRQKSLKDKC